MVLLVQPFSVHSEHCREDYDCRTNICYSIASVWSLLNLPLPFAQMFQVSAEKSCVINTCAVRHFQGKIFITKWHTIQGSHELHKAYM